MKAEVNFDYWNTLYEYLDKKEFKLNGDIIHDARIIKRVQYLWENASEKYLESLDIKYLVKIWTDIDDIVKLTTYKEIYETFISYLFYATDRMVLNRWSFLQTLINRASDFVFKEYKGNNWTDEVCDGFWGDRYTYNIEINCQTEWEEKILPLIKQAQRNED